MMKVTIRRGMVMGLYGSVRQMKKSVRGEEKKDQLVKESCVASGVPVITLYQSIKTPVRGRGLWYTVIIYLLIMVFPDSVATYQH